MKATILDTRGSYVYTHDLTVRLQHVLYQKQQPKFKIKSEIVSDIISFGYLLRIVFHKSQGNVFTKTISKGYFKVLCRVTIFGTLYSSGLKHVVHGLHQTRELSHKMKNMDNCDKNFILFASFHHFKLFKLSYFCSNAVIYISKF